jgi:sugar phosphate isomerase/epimerase
VRFGIGSYSYNTGFTLAGRPGGPPKWDVFDVLDRAAEFGVDGVYIDAGHVGSLEAGHLAEVRAAASEKALALELGYMGTDLEALRPWLEAAVALGSPVLRTFLSRDRYRPPIEQQIEAAVVNLRETVLCAEDLGVRLAIENHMDLTSVELLRIAAEVASPWLGFCLDTGNTLAVLEQPLAAARNLAPLVFMVHLKDARITLEADRAVMHGVPLGEGIVPLCEIVDVLRARAPDCGVWLESLVVPRDTDAETWAAAQAAVGHGVRYAREVLGF